MKRQALQSIILALTTTFAGQAYMAEKGDIIASVPFDFSIGGSGSQEPANTCCATMNAPKCSRSVRTASIARPCRRPPLRASATPSSRAWCSANAKVVSSFGRFCRQRASRNRSACRVLNTDERLREVDARTICIHEDAGLGIASNWH